MRNAIRFISGLLLTCVGFLGCGGSQSSAQAPTETESAAESTAEPPTPSPEGTPARRELTAEECESGGGAVVGDIGDGAIHRADYRCPNGAEPSGTIRAPEGGPIAVEGSVCCPK